MTTLRRHCFLAFALAASGTAAFSAAPPAAPAQAPATPPAEATKPEVDSADGKTLSAAERLAATAKLYGQAKSYRDECSLTREMAVGGQRVVSTYQFTTAFERDRRFRWQLHHSCTPGAKPDQSYTIWSTDGKAFDSYWTVTGERRQAQGIDMPLSGATGVSGGAATVIIPMLRISKDEWGGWGIRSAELLDPADKGTEIVDGVECWKIEGRPPVGDATVTLWIGSDGLLRKLHEAAVVGKATVAGPAKGLVDPPKAAAATQTFTCSTTITIKPFINEPKIDDAKFVPDERNADKPVK